MNHINYILKKEVSEDKDKDNNCDTTEIEVKNHKNHIYFYSDINNTSAQQLNINIANIIRSIFTYI